MPRPAFRLLERKGDKQYFTVIVVGGHPDVFRKVQSELAEYKAIIAPYHWEYQTRNPIKKAPPPDVDFGILLSDMLGSGPREAAAEAFRKAKIPLIRSSRKWVNLKHRLLQHGIEDKTGHEQAIVLLRSMSVAKRQEQLLRIVCPIAKEEPKPLVLAAPTLPEVIKPSVFIKPIVAPFKDIPFKDIIDMIREKLTLEGLKYLYVTTDNERFEAE